jgi:hypothetical protein
MVTLIGASVSAPSMAVQFEPGGPTPSPSAFAHPLPTIFTAVIAFPATGPPV